MFVGILEKKLMFSMGFYLDEDIRLALTIDIDQSFPEIPVPRGGDWLNVYNEPGQTAEQFEKSRKVRPSAS